MTGSAVFIEDYTTFTSRYVFPVFSSAADWKLDEPAWSGRLKITAKGKMAYIKLEDKNTGRQKKDCFN